MGKGRRPSENSLVWAGPVPVVGGPSPLVGGAILDQRINYFRGRNGVIESSQVRVQWRDPGLPVKLGQGTALMPETAAQSWEAGAFQCKDPSHPQLCLPGAFVLPALVLGPPLPPSALQLPGHQAPPLAQLCLITWSFPVLSRLLALSSTGTGMGLLPSSLCPWSRVGIQWALGTLGEGTGQD